MKLAKYVKFREEKFGGVLFETRAEKVFTLNPTAALIVREIEAGHNRSEIAENLGARFDGDAAAIEQELSAFLADLRGKGLTED